jgi:2-dehydro-3-deoxygluconokinase
METRLDVIGIGECLIELSAVGDGLYQLGYSGDVLNALSAACRLGLSTGLLSALGDDPFTDGLADVLAKEQIDISHAPALEGKANGLYFIHPDDIEDHQFHFLRKDSAATYAFVSQPLHELVEFVRGARALLFSSIPLAVMKERERLISLIREAHESGVKVCFDLNVRLKLWENLDELRDLLPEVAPYIDVLFVTNHDDSHLFGSREPAAAVDHYANLGYTEVVYRRGADPTIVGLRPRGASSTTIFDVPVPRVVTVVDPTGAGDAFNAGYIAALLRNHPPYECAAMGNATASCSIEVRGGRGTGITVERVERHYRPLVKWGTFKGPVLAMSARRA